MRLFPLTARLLILHAREDEMGRKLGPQREIRGANIWSFKERCEELTYDPFTERDSRS